MCPGFNRDERSPHSPPHLLKIHFNIVTDLMNALPGNSSLNTDQHATIEEAVFSTSAVTPRSGEWWSRDMCFLWCVSDPRLCK
jgi:hypothetical protein